MRQPALAQLQKVDTKKLARALRRTAQPTVLAFLMAEPDAARREIALSELHSPLLLARYARTESAPASLRLVAIKKIDAHMFQDILFDIAADDADADVRNAACSCIENPCYLQYLIHHANAVTLPMATDAVKRLPINSMVIDVARESPFPALRKTAMRRIFDNDIIEGIAVQDEDLGVRREAIDMIEFPELRKKLLERLRQDTLLDDARVLRFCESLSGSQLDLVRSCLGFQQLLDGRELPSSLRRPLIDALIAALDRPVDVAFDKDLVSAVHGDCNANNPVAHLLARLYGEAATHKADKAKILAQNGRIVSYADTNTIKSDGLLRRQVFDAAAENGIRMAT